MEVQEEEDNELFTRIWNLREEIFSLSQIDKVSQRELLTKGLELYQKDRKQKKSLISQIQKNLLLQLGINNSLKSLKSNTNSLIQT